MAYKKPLVLIVFLMFFVFFIDKLADKFYWYNSIWYLDMIMHFLGGLWVGLFFIYIYYYRASKNLVFKIIFSVLLVGISWEIFEFITFNMIGRTPFDYLDTLADIFFDLSGGLLAILYLFKKIMPTKEVGVQ
jgi:hypothetical protein